MENRKETKSTITQFDSANSLLSDAEGQHNKTGGNTFRAALSTENNIPQTLHSVLIWRAVIFSTVCAVTVDTANI